MERQKSKRAPQVHNHQDDWEVFDRELQRWPYLLSRNERRRDGASCLAGR